MRTRLAPMMRGQHKPTGPRIAFDDPIGAQFLGFAVCQGM